MKYCLWVLLLCSAFAASSYQTGKLVSISDSRSSRIVQNQATGEIIDVAHTRYRLSVLIDNMIYVADYKPRFRWSYRPTDLIVNDPISVRIEGKHLYFKDAQGKEERAEIMRRERQPQP